MKADPTTLEALYLRHAASLRRLVQAARVPPEDVEDVVHEIVASLHATLADRAPERASLDTWLFAAARNHIHVYFRQVRSHERRKAALAVLPEVELSPGLDPEEELLQEEGRRVIEAVLARMAPLRRAVLECRLFRDLPWSAIVDTLGISESTAMRRYSEACRELEVAYARWAAGRAYALPLPLLLALCARGRLAAIGSLFGETAEEASDHGTSATADAPIGLGLHDRALATYTTSARLRRSPRAERCAAPPVSVLRRLRRSRLTHFLLGGVVGALALLLFQRLSEPPQPPFLGADRLVAVAAAPGAATTHVAPPPFPPPMSEGPAPASASPPASLTEPGPSAAARAADREAWDRNLISAARMAATKGERDQAVDILRRHAVQFPNSKHAEERKALLAQLSK